MDYLYFYLFYFLGKEKDIVLWNSLTQDGEPSVCFHDFFWGGKDGEKSAEVKYELNRFYVSPDQEDKFPGRKSASFAAGYRNST